MSVHCVSAALWAQQRGGGGLLCSYRTRRHRFALPYIIHNNAISSSLKKIAPLLTFILKKYMNNVMSYPHTNQVKSGRVNSRNSFRNWLIYKLPVKCLIWQTGPHLWKAFLSPSEDLMFSLVLICSSICWNLLNRCFSVESLCRHRVLVVSTTLS